MSRVSWAPYLSSWVCLPLFSPSNGIDSSFPTSGCSWFIVRAQMCTREDPLCGLFHKRQCVCSPQIGARAGESLVVGKPRGLLITLIWGGMQLSHPGYKGNYYNLGTLSWKKPPTEERRTLCPCSQEASSGKV